LFDLYQAPSFAKVNVEKRHECYPAYMITPEDQALTYVLNGPDIEITILFDEFKVVDKMPGASCPVAYSLLNFADRSIVAASEPYEISGGVIAAKITFKAKF
jgi:hypothetical protein